VNYVALDAISYRYPSERGGDVNVIRNVTLTVEKGEFCCLIGRSGCGKSTLLKLAGGLLEPTAGTAALEGRSIQAGEDIGFVFQQPTLLEWRSVMDNLLLPIALRRKPSKEERAYAVALLQQMGLEAYADRYPQQLSGGQQSRVALARALVTNPKLILLDEPFAALDAITREELQEELLKLADRNRMTALFVTHDIGEAVFLADRVLTLQDGEIRQETSIPTSRPRARALRYEAEFLSIARTVRQTLEEDK
jgi:NitT/TauT family transport system ATP-binding protein